MDKDVEAEAARIGAELASLGPVLPGTLTERRLTCTHAGCGCHRDAARRHGPYWYWTRKVDGKTVTKVLSAQQVEEYRPWLEANKRLRALVQEFQQLGVAVVEADPRTPTRS